MRQAYDYWQDQPGSPMVVVNRPRSINRLLRAKIPGLAGPLHLLTRHPPWWTPIQERRCSLVSFLSPLHQKPIRWSVEAREPPVVCITHAKVRSYTLFRMDGRRRVRSTTHRVCPRLSAKHICGTKAVDARLDRAGTVCL